jgi:hypothetical protein
MNTNLFSVAAWDFYLLANLRLLFYPNHCSLRAGLLHSDQYHTFNQRIIE